MIRFLLLLETALVITTVLIIACHAVWLGIRAPRAARHLEAARSELAGWLDDPTPGTGDLVRTRQRTIHERIALFVSLAGALTGPSKERMTSLAGALGLLTRAAHRCRSRSWARRLEGVRLFTVLGDGADHVPAHLADPSEDVRAQAARWAADHPSPDIVERLVQLLADPATLCRFAVQDTLLRLGSAATPTLRRHLAAGTGPLADMLEVARWSGDASFLEPALRLRAHPSVEVRAGAVRLLGGLGGPAATEALLSGLDDVDAAVRAAAAGALGRAGQWTAAVHLGRRLADPSWDVRNEAALALDRLGDPGRLFLRRALADPDPFAADIARQILDVPVRPTVGREAG